jgi:hypothetical protein
VTDRGQQLRQRLARIRPSPLSAKLHQNIADALSLAPSPWPDRCLLLAIGSGLAAACVIVSILFVQYPSAGEPVRPVPSANGIPHFSDYPIAVAQADQRSP